MIGESLSGTGNIGWRARVNAVWAAGMVGALIVLVSEDGIRGAAWAHAALFVPLALAYGTLGARKIGLDGGRVLTAVVPLVAPFAVQCLVTFGVAALLRTAGIEDGWAALGGAVVGVVSLAVVLLRLPSSPLAEGRAVLADALGRGQTP
jgi:hypothetical protein